jgi:iron complex transport system substrate-binding protein
MRNDPEARRPACPRLLVTPSVKGGCRPKVRFGEVPRWKVGAPLLHCGKGGKLDVCEKVSDRLPADSKIGGCDVDVNRCLGGSDCVRPSVFSERLPLAVIITALSVLILGGHVNAVTSGQVTVIDALGREVKVDLPVEAIVSIAPSNTEILFALGLGEKVVGVTEACDYPEDAKSKPKVGQVEMNIEKIANISPDLVVAVASMQLPVIETLSSLGIPVLALDPKNLSDVLDSITLVGKVTGREEAARLLVERLKSRIQDIQRKAAKAVAGEGRPRVFVEIWDDPLMTAGPGTFIDELIRLAGGENIAGDAGMEWPEFSLEVVIERDPDVIITVWREPEDVCTRPAWSRISACKTRRIQQVNPDILTRPGPRLVEGLAELLEIMHPGSID